MPRAAGRFCPGAPETSAGELAERQLLRAKTLKLPGTDSTQSFDSTLRQMGSNDVLQTPTPKKTSSSPVRLDDRQREAHEVTTPQVETTPVFSIDYNTGWQGFLPVICKNYEWSQHALRDTQGTMFPFTDDQGTLDTLPAQDHFPLQVVRFSIVDQASPLNGETQATSGRVASRDPFQEDLLGEIERAALETNETETVPPEPAPETGTPLPETVEPSEPQPEATTASASGGTNPPNTKQMYEDGTYWQKLDCNSF